MENCRQLIVSNIVRNGFLWSNIVFDWSNIVFDEAVISHSEKTEAFCYASESTQICATRVFFLSLLFWNFDDQLNHKIFTDLLLYAVLENWSSTIPKVFSDSGQMFISKMLVQQLSTLFSQVRIQEFYWEG